MKSRTRSRKPASIGSNHSSRRPTAISPSEPRTGNFVLLLVMAWSPPAHNAGSFGFQHPETTPPSIPTTLRTAPEGHCDPHRTHDPSSLLSSANSKPVVFYLDHPLDRNHLADRLDLIKPVIFLRAGSELRRGDKVRILGS